MRPGPHTPPGKKPQASLAPISNFTDVPGFLRLGKTLLARQKRGTLSRLYLNQPQLYLCLGPDNSLWGEGGCLSRRQMPEARSNNAPSTHTVTIKNVRDCQLSPGKGTITPGPEPGSRNRNQPSVEVQWRQPGCWKKCSWRSCLLTDRPTAMQQFPCFISTTGKGEAEAGRTITLSPHTSCDSLEPGASWASGP